MKFLERGDTRTSFIDMLISGQMNLFVIFMMALLLINPVTPKKDGMPPKAEYVMSMRWDKAVDCDVDLWVRGPSGKVVYWMQKDIDNMHLERDDTGTSNDTRVIEGKTYVNEDNTEHWVLRSIVPGEYTINVHLYRIGATCKKVVENGMTTIVTLSKVNPTYTDVKYKEIVLKKYWEETHAFRFKIAADGSIERVWEEPAELIQSKLAPNTAYQYMQGADQ